MVCELDAPATVPIAKSIPVPERATDCGLVVELSAIVSVAPRGPMPEAWNVVVITQLPPGPIVAGKEPQWLLSVKSELPAIPMLSTVSG